MADVFATCGHPRSPENLVADRRDGRNRVRCRTCRNRSQSARREVHGRNPVRSAGEDRYPEEMERASQGLLRALYREHPYVFDAAARSGRLAVYP